ncbi:MAG: DUF1553 domain-containing protein [Verrucomicrobiae bacterium]|nr:DUF1553 domain-containing protein [Verrucomicrobiae bacterium]
MAALCWVSTMPGTEAWGRPGQSFEEARDHWAFQPIRRPALPEVRDADRVRTPVDRFLLARLEAEGRGFEAPAEARTWLRRVTYGLIGLPPTFEDVEALERDDSALARERVVDRLLADPRYGERWGRHWLDVARYADTKDLVLLYGRDAVRPYAYTYRDYAIRAFNEDLPLVDFVRDQLAGDLVEPPLPAWRLAGLGFLTLGRLFDNNPHDRIDDQIDTVTRGMLGLTVSCARCHDHKYDAILIDDYYSLYGVFASTEQPYRLPLIEEPSLVPGGIEFEGKLAGALATLEEHLDVHYERLLGVMRGRLGDYLHRAATTRPDLTETAQFALSLTPDDFRPALVLKTRRLLAERVRPEDRVFGIWAEWNELADDETFADRAREVAERALAVALEHPSGEGPRHRGVAAWLSENPPASREEVPRRHGEMLLALDEARGGRSCGEEAYFEGVEVQEVALLVKGPSSPVWFPRRDTPDHLSRPEKDRYNQLVLALDKLGAHAEQAPPARAMVVTELSAPYEPRVFARGNPSRPTRAVSRSVPRVLTGGEVRPFGAGDSGRLELAEAIGSPDNPLTARVIVNRIWMQHFGEPLVGSPSDFGTRSDPPTHPELLDWLASEFMAGGWRWKPLHRLIVLSGAFAQGTALGGGGVGEGGGPTYEGYPRRRLDLEAMRDTLLFVSGRLDPAMGGRPVDVAGDAGNRRRTVYGLVDRQNLPGLFRAFDFATPDQCVERRPYTTVPQQALFAMNAPFTIEQAKALAAATERIPEAGERVGAMVRQVLGRRAQEGEIRKALAFVEGEGDSEAERGTLSAWEQLAQVFLISNEAVFLD